MKIAKILLVLLALFPAFLIAQERGNLSKKGNLSLGIAAQHDAAFPGARKTHVLPIPLINWEQDYLFIRSSKGMEEAGVRWQINDEFAVGSQLVFELGRNSDDSIFLQELKMPDIPYGVSAGVQAQYSTKIGPAPVDALLRLRQRSGSQRGALADVRVEVGVYGNRFIGVQTYVQSTWANRQAMNSDFGIKPVNASFVEILPYEAEAGLRNYLVGVAGKLDLDAEWMAIGSIEYNSLIGDAADSPITEKKTSQAVTLGVMYKF